MLMVSPDEESDGPAPSADHGDESIDAPVEIYVAPTPRLAREDRLALVLAAGLGSGLIAVWAPLAALAWALPLVVIAALGVGAALSPPSLGVRIDARGFRCERPGYVSFTPWSRITRFVRGPDAFIAERDDGVLISMPWSSQPDVAGIVSLALVALPSIPDEEPTARRSPRAILVWIVLGLIMLAINHLIAAAR